MHVAEFGEFELIHRLAARLRPPSHPPLVNVGDDAAAWSGRAGAVTVATTDALIENIHFSLTSTSWRDLGWKALAENVSDIAAMGCAPRYALVAIALSGEHQVADVEELYEGMQECATAYDFGVVGGDVVRGPCLMISVTVTGESWEVATGGVAPERLLMLRSAARPGDLVGVTGRLGGSAGGLRLIQRGDVTDSELLTRHRRPAPRVAEGRTLRACGVACALDVSDGLVQDLGHICEMSDVDALLEIDRVPLEPEAVQRWGLAVARDLALTGGEDYELLCAAPAEQLDRAAHELEHAAAAPLTIIGRIVPRAGETPVVRAVDPQGHEVPLPARGGYQHFGPTGEAGA